MSEDIVLSDRNVPRTPLHEELTRLYSQGYMTVSESHAKVLFLFNHHFRTLLTSE